MRPFLADLANASSGQRNKAEYHSLGDFTDEHMHSDFHFLMDVERMADNAHRGAYQAKLNVCQIRPNKQSLARESVAERVFPLVCVLACFAHVSCLCCAAGRLVLASPGT